MFSFFGGGLGGNPESDGLNHANNPISTATIPPAEILEAAYPVMFTHWALRPDSAGAGPHRGGLGAVYEIEAAGGAPRSSLLGERGKYPPFGVAGGGPARAEPVLAGGRRASGTRRRWPPRSRTCRSARGERVRLETPGGGGWGEPRDRDRRCVARDVRLGYVGAAGARELMRSCSRLTTASTSSRPLGVIGTTREGADDGRRRRRRRHLHRLLLLRRSGKRVRAPPRCRRIAATRRAGSWKGSAPLETISALASIVHGTTVGTNALLERKGACIGLITTSGLSRRLEMRRRDRRNTWGLWGDFAPVVDRDLRLEVGERTLASGEIRAEVDPEEVRAAARTLLAKGAEALAIVFINAYANPANELAALAAAASVWPNENLSCSSADPARDPRVRAHFDDGAQRLSPAGGRRPTWRGSPTALAQAKFRGSFHVVQSNGGVMSTATARRLAGADGAVGPGRRRHRGGRHRSRRRLPERRHRRSRRHLLRRVARDRRRDRACRPDDASTSAS